LNLCLHELLFIKEEKHCFQIVCARQQVSTTARAIIDTMNQIVDRTRRAAGSFLQAPHPELSKATRKFVVNCKQAICLFTADLELQKFSVVNELRVNFGHSSDPVQLPNADYNFLQAIPIKVIVCNVHLTLQAIGDHLQRSSFL